MKQREIKLIRSIGSIFLRLISAPFILCLLLISMNVEVLIRFFGHLCYGGEWVRYHTNKQKTQASLQKIYDELLTKTQ